ncbi:type I polyketide synthase [Sphaerotilus sp.]|uniref:type I polyketide synthase n=1 Tax=Sphaerotilus sp. TaxID=2093942 RepID=UPI0025F7E32D|nr:type I polyketide synthase [Sphaerotilus sp.]
MTLLSLSHPILAPLDRCRTVGEALLRSGQGTRGVTYLHSSTEHERVGYAELGHRAIATLGHLQACGVVPGDTVVLVTEDLALFTAVFWACALGGFVVAPIATPANEDGHTKLANVVETLPGAWLASDQLDRLLVRLPAGAMAPEHLLALGRTMFEATPGCLHEGAGPDDVVLLQFSSGSTGQPKGVRITSRNLLANTSGFVQRCQLAADRDLMLNWMPLTHDFGIVFCHVLPVLFGIEQALIPTMVFMRHPLMWMQKASELGATVSAGPNYAYQHFLKRFRADQDYAWDLRALRLVINGAEPISCGLSRSFFQALHRYGLSPLAATPGYGLAEATLMVTLNRPEVPFESIVLDRYRLAPGTRLARLEFGHPDAIECANVGPASDNVELRITDAHRQPVDDGVIGTVETRGACVTLGYHGMPELNQATISAEGWLDTGDLGFISDGHLYITGRRKDLVIINGANYYPHDIENIAAQVPPLDLNMVLACAIPLPEQDREGLAIFVRTRVEGEAFLELADRVRDHVLQHMGVPVDHCLPVQQIPKTTSGKLRRFLLAQQFQAGTFDADVQASRDHMARGRLRQAWDRGERVAFRAALVAEAARLAPWADWTDPETAQAPLMELGFGSLRVVEFLNRLNLALQQQWPVSMMFDHASVDRLAEHLLTQRGASLVPVPDPVVPPLAVHSKDSKGRDIAIIGLGCRFPGEADTPEAFWTLLVESTDTTGPFPADRWNPALNASATTDRGAYLQGLDRFDHRFFRLTPVEAERLDPQQRLLLSVSWEALESAGLDPLRLKGSDTGVFTGISGSDYAQAEARGARLADIGPYAFSGSATSIASGRLSFFYGFEGPNVALDTACSSALSAVHGAVRSLRAGECDLALASAVNLILSPEMQVGLSRMNALSPDGRCRTFDAAADGYARGEGCASVVLKRLEDALRDGDPIRAVIKGSAMNHDGASNGLTAPNGRAQEKVIRAALRDAGLAPGDIDYVECHGTGTALGDPVEVMALAAAYGSGHGDGHPLWVGSVKTNVAHLEAAAGMASLCKVVAALEHGTLPPTLHQRQPNPMIPWDTVPVRVVDQVMPWPSRSPDQPRRAGLSAFGMSGTNVHLLLEAAPVLLQRSPPSAMPERDHTAHTAHTGESVLVALSARTEGALVAMAHRHAAWLRAHPDRLDDLARTVACHRTRWPVRQSVVGRDAADVAQALERIAPARRPTTGTAPPVVFVFPGQGSQQAGAVRDLIDREPVFRAALEQAQQVLDTYLPRPLLDLLQDGTSEELAETGVTQAVVVACGLALAALWRSWGIQPQAVLGHSVGEITAAAVAGAITPEAALRFAAERGALMQRLPTGAMLAVACGVAEVRDVLQACGADLSIAAINGPRALTLSGTPQAVATAADMLAARGLRHSRLDVTRAFHSAMMDPILAELDVAAQRLQPIEPGIALHSGVTGERVDAALLSPPGFWSRHAREPVRYHDALLGLSLPGAIHIELGTRPVLATLAALHLPDTPWLTCADGAAHMLHPVRTSLGRVHDLGGDVDWTAVFCHRPGRFADVPSYPFQGLTPMLPTVRPETSHLPAGMGVSPSAFSSFSAAPAPAPVPAPHATVQTALRKLVRNVAGLQDEDITPDANWFALGLDSLLVLQLQLALCKDFGVDIKLQDVFEHGTTLNDLSALVMERLPADSPLRAPPPVVPTASVAPDRLPVAPAAVTLPMPGGDVEALLARQIDALGNLFRQQLEVLQGLGATGTDSPVAAPVRTPARAPVVAAPVATTAKAVDPIDRPPTREIKGLYKKIPSQKANWGADKLAHVRRLAADYNARTAGSKRLATEGRTVYANPRAVIGFRPEWKELTYPLHVDRADGAHVWDVDGHRYVDITMGFGATLLGHNPSFVREAVTEELQRGAPLGPQTPHALRVAQLIADMTGAERVGFFTTGSEAVMVAARLARAVTQRTRIVIFTNAYHGTFDGFLAMGWVDDGQPRTYPLADGTPAGMVEDVVVLRYGDARSLEVIRGMAHELAAVLVEPVQSRDPAIQPTEFLHELRQITAASGTALVFDEMIMGFRVHPGGAQHHFGIQADICTYGKVVGGGLPIGVVAGKARFLDAIDGGAWQYGDDSVPSARTAFVAGTFNSHPLSMAAAAAVLTHLRDAGPALQERLNARTAALAARLNTVFEQEQAPIRCVHFSSLFRFEFAEDTEVLNYHLLRQGVFVWEGRNCFLSTAHSDEDIDFLVQAVCQGVREMRVGGYLPALDRDTVR